MEPEFMLPARNYPFALRARFETHEPHLADYDRALSKSEIIELLATDEIEFELLLANELLSPSLTLEYYPSNFLGFFTYWDCLSARLAAILLGHIEDIEAVTDLTDEFVPQIADTLINTPFTLKLEEKTLRHTLHALTDAIIPLLAPRYTALTQDQVMVELAAGVIDLEDRFRVLIADERPHSVSPFALNCEITSHHSHC